MKQQTIMCGGVCLSHTPTVFFIAYYIYILSSCHHTYYYYSFLGLTNQPTNHPPARYNTHVYLRTLGGAHIHSTPNAQTRRHSEMVQQQQQQRQQRSWLVGGLTDWWQKQTKKYTMVSTTVGLYWNRMKAPLTTALRLLAPLGRRRFGIPQLLLFHSVTRRG